MAWPPPAALRESRQTLIAVPERGWIGGGNVGRNTTIIRSNYLLDGNEPFGEFSLRLWEGLKGVVAYLMPEMCFSLSPLASAHTNDPGRSRGREAVHQCDADLDFGGLAVGVSRGNALAEGFETSQLGLDPASDMVSRPALPECPAVVPGGAQGFVAGARCRTIFLPRTPVLADRDDRAGLAVDDGGMTAAGVMGTVSGHRADLFALRS